MLLRGESSSPLLSYRPGRLQKIAKKLKKVLHLWKFPVISQMRTNFADMSGKTQHPGSREKKCLFEIGEAQGRRGGESESLKEAAIEIGNS